MCIFEVSMTNTVLITGANRGLGLEMVRQYAAAGWAVLACCREPDSALPLREMAKRYPQIEVHRLDVSDFDQIDFLSRELAGRSIDIIINNAGVYGDNEDSAFGQMDYLSWQAVLRVNTLAPVKIAEAFLSQVASSSHKLIVVMTSLMGSIADNKGGGSIMYRSSKAALNAAMKSLAIDLKPRGVGVLILHPGWVKTDMGGANAPILPEESISGLRRVIEAYHPEDSGRFFDFRGKELPW